MKRGKITFVSSLPPFRIKICGVRFPRDVLAVAGSEADAIGLNFFPRSVRYLSPGASGTAELVRLAHRHGLKCVGVFVNETPERVRQIVAALDLDAAQLHGDEPVEEAQNLAASGLPVIRAVKLPVVGLTAELLGQRLAERVAAVTQTAPHHQTAPNAWPLLDADAGSAHGGSGQRLDWSLIGQWSAAHPGRGWGLAGGLSPDTVGRAVDESRAKSVDVAGGVESPRGTKSVALIRRFAAAADRALRDVQGS